MESEEVLLKNVMEEHIEPSAIKVRKLSEANKQKRNKWYKATSLIGFFIGWQLISILNQFNGWFNPVFLPSPSMIIETAYDYLAKGTLFTHIGISLYRTLCGFFIGTLVAIILGVMITSWKWVDNLLSPILNMIGPIPVFAFLPMFIIWFGIGEGSKITLVAYATFMPLLTYTMDGIRNTDPVLIRAAISLGATKWQVFSKVIFKSALPNIFVGMKVSLALTFSALVVAEMMGASSGLGYIIVEARNWFKMTDMFLAAALIGIEYTIFYGIITLFENVLFKWKKGGLSDAVES